jgi:outer membrane immunogenic protein
MRKIILAAVLSVVAQAAHAADMPDLPVLRGSLRDGYGPARSVWEGFYVGGQAGYGATVSNIPTTINSDLQPAYVAAPGSAPPLNGAYRWPGLPSPQADNASYGAFAGYNSSWEDVVIGIEGNYIHGRYNTVTTVNGTSTAANGTPLATTSTAAIKIDDFGSLRLRAGYAAGNYLPYAFVGAGIGKMLVDRSTVMTPGPASTDPLQLNVSQSNLVYGYSAGLGVDVLLFAGVFFRAEYEYQRITWKNIDTNVSSGRLGLGYRF